MANFLPTAHRPLSMSALLLFCLYTLFTASHVAADVPFIHDQQGYQDGKYGRKPTQGFHSAPHIRAPIWQVNKFDYARTDKTPYILTTGNMGGGGSGPSMMSSKDLSLVWSDETFSTARAALTYMYKGERVLMLNVHGNCAIFNQKYEKIAEVGPKSDEPGLKTDFHDCFLSDDDTILLIYCRNKPTDLTPIGGPKTGDGVRDCYLQEVDAETNEVMFEFSMFDHYPIETTLWPYRGEGLFHMGNGPHDYCHMNSVQKYDGDYLISLRHFSSLVCVDGKTGYVKWTLGGRRNQFRDITENGSAMFAYQHHARFIAPNRITLFDNAVLWNGFADPDSRTTRGLELEIDPEARTVRVVNEWHHPQGIISASRGGVTRLPNGGTIIAWGQNPMYTEYTADNELVLDIQRGGVIMHDHGFVDSLAYRVSKTEWEGQPTWGPNISAAIPHGSSDDAPKQIFVSWNGATKVEKWVLLLSGSEMDLNGADKVATEIQRLGFETPIEIPHPAAFARVAAISAEGSIIGSTPVVNIATGGLIDVDYQITDVGSSATAPPPPPPPQDTPAASPSNTQAPPVASPRFIRRRSEIVEEPVGNSTEDSKESSQNSTEGSTSSHMKFCHMAIEVALRPVYLAAGLTLGVALCLIYGLRRRTQQYLPISQKV